MTRVLITGGAGFIGSHIAQHWCDAGAEVLVLDSLRSGHRHNLDALAVRFVEGSITDRELVTTLAEGVDYIFHLAALVSVPESMEKPWDCVDINVNGLLNVLEAARRHQVKKVVHSSSAACYGDDPTVPKLESMRPAPISPYGITKLDGEYYLEMYRREYGVPTTSLRYFNVFGPRQDPKSQYAAVVPIFIERALQSLEIKIYGDGEQTRDFIFVKDVVAANVHAATTPAMSGTYNVGRGGRMTVNELAQTIIGLTRSTSTINHLPERPGDIRHSMADVTRLTSTGWQPRFSLEDGLHSTVEFFARQLAAR
ncbi:MAG: SDR family oxidoreductase [Candidatus Xenobia bacterium]